MENKTDSVIDFEIIRKNNLPKKSDRPESAEKVVVRNNVTEIISPDGKSKLKVIKPKVKI